jgi:CheY-like chemotaxis protein
MARILVVDDSIVVAKFTEMILVDQGHDITFAMNGNECLQKLGSREFDLVILDVVMPGKNGFQICREIKSNSRFSSVPVIMMTTKGQASDKFWGMRQGADAYLVKPCPEQDLIDTVNRFVAPPVREKVAPAPEAVSEVAPAAVFPAAEPVADTADAVALPQETAAVETISEEVLKPVSFGPADDQPAAPAEKDDSNVSTSFYTFEKVIEREMKKEEAHEPPEGAAAPLSQTRKAATMEHPALPVEEKKKKHLSLRERLQNSFYRFNN